jgi:hypothetical protein
MLQYKTKQTMNYLGVNTAHIADLSTGTVPYKFPVSAGDAGQVMVTDGEGNLTFETSNVQPPSCATGFFQDLSGDTTVPVPALGAFHHSLHPWTLVESSGITQIAPGMLQNTSTTRAIRYLVTVSTTLLLEEQKGDAGELCELAVKNQGVIVPQSKMACSLGYYYNTPIEVSTSFITTVAPLEYLQLAFRNTASTQAIVVYTATLTMTAIT